jgi:ABC-type phosphate transport system ATPase subunit
LVMSHIPASSRSLSILPMRIDLDKLSYSVKGVPILKSVSASFEPGQLVAIMGPSGTSPQPEPACNMMVEGSMRVRGGLISPPLPPRVCV